MTGGDKNWDCALDVLAVLEQHGYHRSDNQRTGQAARAILDLARFYEGTRDTLYDQAPSSPHEGPGWSASQAGHEAVVLTGTEVRTVLAALDLAADYKRDRAETCTDCAKQSCPACQSRLHDAQAYDQMARMLHTAQATPAVDVRQPEPPSSGITPAPADPAPDKEAGQ